MSRLTERIAFWTFLGLASAGVLSWGLAVLNEGPVVQDHAVTCEYPVDEATAQYIRGWSAAFDALTGVENE